MQIKRTKVFSLEAMPSVQPNVFCTQKGWIVIGFLEANKMKTFSSSHSSSMMAFEL
jgi:hypothetical protein